MNNDNFDTSDFSEFLTDTPTEVLDFDEFLNQESTSDLDAEVSSVNLFDLLQGDLEVDSEVLDFENNEKSSTSISIKESNIRIALAQYLRLWQQELNINTLNVKVEIVADLDENLTHQSRLASMFLDSIGPYGNNETKVKLFKSWYFGDDLGDVEHGALHYFVSFRGSILRDALNIGLEESYLSYASEILHQLGTKCRNEDMLARNVNPELKSLIEELDELIFINPTVRDSQAEQNSKRLRGIPLTTITSGDLVLDMSDKKIYEKYDFPIAVSTNPDNELTFKCTCGKVLNAQDCLSYVEESKNGYQRVRPVECPNCKKMLILNQILLFLLAFQLFASRDVSGDKSMAKQTVELGRQMLDTITSDDAEVSVPIKKALQVVLIGQLYDEVDKGVPIDITTLKSSYFDFVDKLILEDSIAVTKEPLLCCYLLTHNGVSVTTKSMVSYIYSRLDTGVYKGLALSNYKRRLDLNNNKFKSTVLEYTKNPLFKDMLGPAFMTKAFLNKQTRVNENVPTINVAELSKDVEEVVKNITIDQYLQANLDASVIDEIYHSGFGEIVESLLIDTSLRETLYSLLFNSFINSLLKTSGSVINIPQPVRLKDTNIRALRHFKKENGTVTSFNIYEVFGVSSEEANYAASENLLDTGARYYKDYKPTNTLELEKNAKAYLDILRLVENIDDIIALYYGFEDIKESPWESQLQRTLLLKAIIDTFPEHLWYNKSMFYSIEAYLDETYRRWEIS